MISAVKAFGLMQKFGSTKNYGSKSLVNKKIQGLKKHFGSMQKFGSSKN